MLECRRRPFGPRCLDQSAELLEQSRRTCLPGGMACRKQRSWESLTAREQLGSTGLGHGVAIPHARMYQCDTATGVFVRTKAPVPFDAPDGKPVSIFLALVVPKQATQRHLQLPPPRPPCSATRLSRCAQGIRRSGRGEGSASRLAGVTGIPRP